MEGTMKAIIKKDLSRGISVENVPIPKPGEGEVLVKVRACGICGSDVHLYEGDDSYKWCVPYMPLIMGHEFSGDIVELGDNVDNVTVGERVICKTMAPCGTCYQCTTGKRHFCGTKMKDLFGLSFDGGMAEYCVVQADRCLHMPDNVSYELGALIEPLGIAGNAVYDSGLRLGESVAIQGPGTIGLMTLLIAKARGAGQCIVIGTKKDRKRLEVAEKFGADHIILADEVDSLQAVLDLTSGRGANVVFETSGAPALIQTAVDMTEKVGRTVLVGIYPRKAEFDFTNFVRSGKKLFGTYGGPDAWETLVNWIGAKTLYGELLLSVVSHMTPIEKAEEAFQRSINKENIKELFVFE